MTSIPDDQSTPKHSTEPTAEDPQPVSASSHASNESRADDATGTKDFGYVKDTDTPPSAHEESLLHKLSEVGNDTVKRLKEVLSEIDRDEVKKNINRDRIQHSVASAFDSLNTKVQELLAPKGENRKREYERDAAASTSPHMDPFSGQSSEAPTTPLSTATPSAPGPVGTEAVQPETTKDPFLRNPEDTPRENRGF